MDIFTAIARLLEVFASTNMLPSMGTKSNMIMFLTVLGLCYSSELEKRRIFEEAGEADVRIYTNERVFCTAYIDRV